MRKRAENDHVDPALEIVSNVAELLTGVQTAMSLIHKERHSTQARHASLKRQPRS